MICVVQRVLEASVEVDLRTVGAIGAGLLVLASIERDDTAAELEWTVNKLITLRIFRCCEKHFHIDVQQAGGSLLLVSNFTVAAATRAGRRPSFDPAMPPAQAEPMFERFLQIARATGVPVQTGKFGADMKIRSINDGPTTFLVRSDPKTTA